MKKHGTLIILGLIILVVAGLIVYFFFIKPSKSKNVPKGKSKTPVAKPSSTTPTPPGSPSSKWVEESFPLDLGMYGGYTQQLQAALGIEQDGRFYTDTKNAVIARGASVPLSYSDYTIIALVGQKVYAYSDGIFIQNDDFTGNSTPVKEGDFLGTIQNVIEPASSGPTAQLLGGSYLINSAPGSIINRNIYVQQSDVYFGDLT